MRAIVATDGEYAEEALMAETERFLAQKKKSSDLDDSSSSQQAAHLLEQWLDLHHADKKSKQQLSGAHSPAVTAARMIFLKWLDSAADGDARSLSQYFHRVLSITSAPEAYPLYQSYYHNSSTSTTTDRRPTSAAICMVVERMLPYQWGTVDNDEHSATAMILSDIELLDDDNDDNDNNDNNDNKRRAQNAFLAHVPHWSADRAQSYLESSIRQPDAYSYAAIIAKHLAANNIDTACALALQVTRRTSDHNEDDANTVPNTTYNNELGDGATICTNLCLWALAQRPERQHEVEPLFRAIQRPNTYSYSALLQALSPEKGRQVILTSSHDGAAPLLNAHCYGLVMAKFAHIVDNGEIVEELLHHASHRFPTSDLDVLKGLAIRAWGQTHTYGAPDRATAIYMTTMVDNGDDSSSSPALTTALLQVWAQSTRPDAAERCVTIFQTMVNQGTATTAAFHLMLSAQTSDVAWDMIQGQAQLLTMVGGTGSGSGWVMPVAASWATVLAAQPGHSVERIYEIVAHYKQSLMHKKKQRDDVAVFVQAVRVMPTVSDAHAFVVQECRSFSQHHHHHPQQQQTRRRSYSKVYLALLKRWSRSREAVAPERAEEIGLWIAQEEEEEVVVAQMEEGNEGLTTAEQVRHLLIETWTRSNRAMAPARIGYLEKSLLVQ
jgi:hypothetical protein